MVEKIYGYMIVQKRNIVCLLKLFCTMNSLWMREDKYIWHILRMNIKHVLDTMKYQVLYRYM